ncbi:MAG: hypothetical protein ACE5HP_02590 [Gemmatimonadota bacterium]
MERLEADEVAGGLGSPTGNGVPRAQMDAVELALERFREEAARVAREDAAAGVPELELEGRCHSEDELRERARAFFERWHSRERGELDGRIAETEERISDELGRTSLLLDRFERLTNDLVRLKARLSVRRREVNEALGEEQAEKARPRGIPTRVYVAALGFLGAVEFFANAPVFSSLLPRDPLTERQIRLVAETSEGWFAGAERVFAQFILRPDAALLAAGVVTFLCVLAHFFGHSLRDLVMHRDPNTPRDTVAARSTLESVVPIILSTLGLLLVIGVLYEARLTLGDVGRNRFEQDMVVVEDLRRQAGWLRVDGDLLGANDMENRADDMEGAASALREYAGAMSRLSFPILLLNMTLVLCAISAAYFHRRDRRSEYFDESPFEAERRLLVEEAESSAAEISSLLSAGVRHTRELRTLVAARPLMQFRSVVHQLEAAISLYRTENGRARGLDPRTIPAFREPVNLEVKIDPRALEEPYVARDPEEYEEERVALKTRFETVRQRFTKEAIVA